MLKPPILRQAGAREKTLWKYGASNITRRKVEGKWSPGAAGREEATRSRMDLSSFLKVSLGESCSLGSQVRSKIAR